ncbi:beta-lactamase family protein [Sphingobacterium kitahiroshimense]|uniref:serine hydrolase domain-containing protein n=1 Tax=Sphingobacterium sp. B16(2022) TaxID=2914044 RepID=UPI00143A5C51|nr:serine hydrolase domain-containing protein [Sphingobacterium sp. B16(2022)]NJI75479.1 beta-lactamase family protein [Sphingobacterium sp. B16(2022)]
MIDYLKQCGIKQFLLFIILMIVKSGFAQQNEIAVIASKIGVPGLSVVHVDKEGKVNSYVYGVKKFGKKSLIDAETTFQAASLTKVLSAYVFFRFYDRGLINLDTPLSEYFDYDRLRDTKDGNKITARMVLTHHSGLLNWEGDVGTATWYKTPLHTQFTPGEDYLYSGEGFFYLQRVLEHLTGKAFQTLVEEEVFIPFAMKRSQIVWKEELRTNTAWGHNDSISPRNRLATYFPANAAYSLYSTPLDYTTFIQAALVRGKGLKKSTHKLMLKECALANNDVDVQEIDRHVPLALGLRIQKNERGIAYWHTGSNPGFRAFFIVYPESGESVVAFNNSDSGMDAMKYLMELFLENNQTFWSYEWRKGELD